jgi:membrane protease YdiL (CAAX protease family)
MDGWIIVLGMYLAIAIAIMVTCVAIRRPSEPKYLAAAIAIFAIDIALTVLVAVWTSAFTQQYSLHWNWMGKGASILFSLLILLLVPQLRIDSGLVIRQRPGSLSWSIGLTVAAALAAGLYAWLQPATAFSMETLLFQASMPTISEELVYRGTLLAALTIAWPKQPKFAAHSVNLPAVVITLVFAVGHGLTWSNALQVSVFSMLSTGAVGAMLMYIRLRSGSLLFPLVAHSLFNMVVLCVPMMH